jgi:SNF2 family DNA or RNA helicase
MTAVPELFKHQKEIAEFIARNQRAMVFADPGTGKTGACLSAIKNIKARAIVLCPKAIMVPAWVRDAQKFTPELSVAVATAPAAKRIEALKSDADIVVVNHDGTKDLAKHIDLLDDFDILVVDESTAFKNKDSQRSKALAKIKDQFTYRAALTGTPMSNGLLDVWHQAYVIDDGEALGSRYYAFRAATHDSVPVTAAIMNWVPKEGSLEAVSDMLSPMTLRYALEDCIDIPEHSLHVREIELPAALMQQYVKMEKQALLALEKGEIEALNAASLIGKLLQIASGSVYGDDTTHELARERYDLIAELVAERTAPCVIGFQWKHQRDGIIKALERAGIDEYAVIDGDTNTHVDDIVEAYQAGKYRALLAHPRTAGHGLTLTRGRTTIWASPTWDAELFEQLNRRIYRTGQQHKTETIILAAKGTADERVVEKLTGKVDAQASALDLLKLMMPTREQEVA